MNTILAAVVTYNRLDLLKKTIAAIEAQSTPCDILLVNNASTDDTEAWFLSHQAAQASSAPYQLLYVNTGANLGGAGGFHRAMKESVLRGYEAVWIMDDDAIPHKDTLEKLVQADAALKEEAKPYGFLSSVVRWTDGSLCDMNRQRLFSHYLQEEDLHNAPALLPLVSATFVSLLIPINTIITVGLPIAEFFIWSDDIEYTTRITRRRQMPAYLVCDSIITHETKSNIGSNIVLDDAERLDRYRYAIRNENYTFRHYSLRMYASYLYHLAKNFFLIFIKSKDCKLKRSRILISGFFRGLFFHPSVEYVERKESDR